MGRVKKPLAGGAKAKAFFGLYWRSIVVVIAPTLFSLIMFTNDDESLVKAYRCLYVVCVVSNSGMWIISSDIHLRILKILF